MSATTNKRQRILDFLDAGKECRYVPAGFFIHFDKACHRGQAAIDKHLEFFRTTGMDFVKIQYEVGFPEFPEIREPEDWSKMTAPGIEFYKDQLEVVEGLVKAASEEALVIQTLYSPFMLAGKAVGPDRLMAHIKADPGATGEGIQKVTDSLLLFVRECIRLGVDGFYTSTQGGEASRLGNGEGFVKCVKPFDLQIMNEVNRSCPFNILHVCDYHASYDELGHFIDYPGHVVNCNLQVGGKALTPQEISDLFGRPYMGGLERKGAIAVGTKDEIREEVETLLARRSDRFILGADCTLPSDVDWDNIGVAIETAHACMAS